MVHQYREETDMRSYKVIGFSADGVVLVLYESPCRAKRRLPPRLMKKYIRRCDGVSTIKRQTVDSHTGRVYHGHYTPRPGK